MAERARSEEDLRIGVEKLLEPALERLGVVAQPRYEAHIGRTVLTAPGRADALYGQAVIEYEPPGKLSTNKGIASTQRQLERYLRGQASASGSDREQALRRMAGIGLDGYSIFFLRYRGDRPPPKGEALPGPAPTATQLSLILEEEPAGSFTLAGPYQVDEYSIQEFLLHLRALRRRPLAADELAKEFGPAGGVAHEMVNALYSRLEECLTTPGSPFPRVQTLYEEWKRIFGIVYGQELVKAQRDADALAKLYHVTEYTDLKPLLFAVHTYYALFMKLLAAELLSLQQGALLASIAEQLPALSEEVLRGRLEEMEKGVWFEAQGIRNFLEADFFGWYLSAWNADVEKAIRGVARALAEYEPATGTLAPEATRDLLKKLYQYLVPKELRHDLGEYYTPDWLAELVLNEVGYAGNPEERLLDPACGSGTFLVLAIRRVLDYAQDSLAWRARSDPKLVATILENLVGFDLNPLAVIAARTNYLLALGSMARHLSGKDIPVYLCDSVLTPQTQRNNGRPLEHQKDIAVPSTQKEFWIPEELIDKGQVDALCRLLERCLGPDHQRAYQTEEFLALGLRELKWEDPLTGSSLVELYEKMLRLKEDGRNGLWARIIKNAFAPVFRAATLFDYVVGNPPWINWESLADEYREATKGLWQRYGLFSLKGHAARLGGGKKDMAMLMLYSAMDSYLRDGGKLGFVITQTVFKTKGAGDGFRRFRLGENVPLRVLSVHDMVELQPFEGASNRTATVVLGKGQDTDYRALTYTLWRKAKPGRIGMELSLEEVEARTKRMPLAVLPVNAAESTSPWLTAGPAALVALQKVLGPSYYKAHAGAYSGGANGVYWLRIIERRPDGLLVVENLHDVGKTKVKKVPPTLMEDNLLYPLLRGRDIARWRAKPSAYILMVQDPVKRTGYDESWLKVTFPHTYAYLKQFESILRSERQSQVVRDLMASGAFYSMYAVAQYTFAPYKVAWTRVAADISAAIVEPHHASFLVDLRSPVPIETATMVPFWEAGEAYYFCGVMNCSAIRLVISSYASKGTGSFGSPHVLEHVAIPQFDRSIALHQSLSTLSHRAHQLAALGKDGGTELRQVETEIDRLAARLWGITDGELEEIHHALAEA